MGEQGDGVMASPAGDGQLRPQECMDPRQVEGEAFQKGVEMAVKRPACLEWKGAWGKGLQGGAGCRDVLFLWGTKSSGTERGPTQRTG